MHAANFETDLAKVLEHDPLTAPIVDAIAAGRELPDEFLILDTYYDIGAPEVEPRCERIRGEVHATLDRRGVAMPTTYTMLDRRATR